MKFVVLCEYAEIVWGKKETNDIREREKARKTNIK